SASATTAGDATTTAAGGAGDATTTTAGGASTTAAAGAGLVAGGDPGGWTDPADLSQGRAVARCDKGAPAPPPLPEMTTIKVWSGLRLEFMSPLLLADSLGELAKENLKLEFVQLPFADAAPQLAQGTIDVGIGGIEIALFNAGHQGLPVKAVMGNYFPPD